MFDGNDGTYAVSLTHPARENDVRLSEVYGKPAGATNRMIHF